MSDLLNFLKQFNQQWQRALLFTRASSLAFASILAIVPLMVMMAAIVSLSRYASQLQTSIENFLFSNFVPSSSQVILGYLQHFSQQAWHLSWWSIGFLTPAVFGILFALESALNAIWQVPERRYWHSLLIYSALLVLSPVWIVGSFALLLPLLPLLFGFFGFTVIFKVLPHAHVQWSAALIGGLSSAVLFEVAKCLFAWYVVFFPSYERIYGVAAALPLFFLWLYFCWLITFFGAVMAFLWQTKDKYVADSKEPLSRA